MKNLVYEAWVDLQDLQVIWQLAVLVVAAGIARLVNRLARFERVEASGVWKFGVGGLSRILAPLIALVLVLVARELLWRHTKVSVDVLDLAVPALIALVLMRIFFYALRHVFAPGGVLAASERSIATVVWLAFLLYVVGAMPEVIAALDSVAFSIGRQRISLWLVLQAAFWALAALLASLWLGSAVEARVMRADGLHHSLRVALSRLSKSLILLLAVLVVLQVVGLDLTVLSVFGGALGVGLGLGLQKVASNYVSGYIILLERAIRVGDMITADNFYGKVSRITTRYAMVEALDGREAIIPNEILIASTVINHTHSNQQLRVSTSVSVAYDADLDRTMALLQEVALAHPRVLKTPPPAAFVTRFADSGIDLELGFWIGDPENGSLGVRSDLNLAIWRAFRDSGIEIPYPQRVVRTAPANSRATS